MARNIEFVLGVDLDGVCADYMYGLKSFIAADRGISVDDLTDEVSWDFPEWDINRAEFEDYHMRAVKESRMFRHLPAIEGASETLWKLSNMGVWIRIITHRLLISGAHAIAAEDTVRWLEDNHIPYRDICFVGGKEEVNAHIYVEDSPDNIKALKHERKGVIIFEQPYNNTLHGLRAKNWGEVETIVSDAFKGFQRINR